jgi:hypothetical protein
VTWCSTQSGRRRAVSIALMMYSQWLGAAYKSLDTTTDLFHDRRGLHTAIALLLHGHLGDAYPDGTCSRTRHSAIGSEVNIRDSYRKGGGRLCGRRLFTPPGRSILSYTYIQRLGPAAGGLTIFCDLSAAHSVHDLVMYTIGQVYGLVLYTIGQRTHDLAPRVRIHRPKLPLRPQVVHRSRQALLECVDGWAVLGAGLVVVLLLGIPLPRTSKPPRGLITRAST